MRALMRWLSSPSLTSWRDVPAAEAWPPSSELGQTAPRMIVPVMSPPRPVAYPFEILRVLPVACPFEILRVRLVACPLRSFASSGAGTISLGCFHLLSWPLSARRDCCRVYAESHEW
jgi:hypothetical protein